MYKSVRISDVAKEAGVSSATVCRVLKGNTHVDEKTCDKVNAAVKKLNYKILPSQLATNQSKLIGVVVGDLRNPFFSDLIYYLQNSFVKYGYVVSPFSTEFNVNKEKQLLEIIKDQNFAALVLFSTKDSNTLQQELGDVKCPVLLADRKIDGFTGNIVVQDNFQAGYMATKYLIDLGYKKVGFIAGNEESVSSMRRVEGYKAALKNALLNVDEDLIVYGPMNIKRGHDEGVAYAKAKSSKPKAMVIANDLTAIGFVEGCKECGVEIPRDVSIVSFDGIELSSLNSFNLTTVRQPVEEMSRQICDLTVSAIQGGKNSENNLVLMNPSLIIRGSAIRAK